MIANVDPKKNLLPLLLLIAVLVSGCGMAASYRPAYQKTIRDYSGGGGYRKTVGVMALSNTTVFTGVWVAEPFMAAFLSGMEAVASNAVLLVPGKIDVPPFLWNSPRMASGDLDVFTLAGQARQEGMNAVVSPILMDIRVRKLNTGFWFFKDVEYRLQIQTAAAIYDVVTGARLALGILTDEIAINESQAGIIRNGREAQVDDLVDVAAEMGEKLGEQMGDAIQGGAWLASVIAVENGAGVIAAGGEAGIAAGDRFTVMDGSGVLIGLGGQRFVFPGPKIGEITIGRVTPRLSFGTPESGDAPPIGSILIPGW